MTFCISSSIIPSRFANNIDNEIINYATLHTLTSCFCCHNRITLHTLTWRFCFHNRITSSDLTFKSNSIHEFLNS